jgi:3-dehydroquinate synthase
MGIDKKSRGNTLRFVGLSSIGKTQRIEGLNIEELSAAYEKISQ